MKLKLLFYIVLILAVSAGCNESDKPASSTPKTNKKSVQVPHFTEDSAYQYIQEQVDFGPRVPNTEAHRKTAAFLTNKLSGFADTVIVQSFKARAYDGTVLNAKNIIASFHPEKPNRLLLCAHWDTRPYADYDEDENLHNHPIDGANDGGSGVGVLLEIARVLKNNPPPLGIDIILFDAEDYGPPQDSQQRNDETNWWALGSQHWASNPHINNYSARNGILLDMVGAENASFYFEGFSMYYAPGFLKKVWKAGHQAGFNEFFIFEQVGYITDDHVPINQELDIPTIDIIHLNTESTNGTFFDHWHTSGDTMDKISKPTLKAVGQTLLQVIFNEQ